ncbi:MAG TPA: hypothetical protein VGD94_24865, partial [Vicinamibacterales bacterium]
QHDAFTDEGLSTFLSATYVVSAKSDRIGCRLDGERIVHRGSPDIVSDGIAFGAIQVAGNGLPMILLADRGTTGGYTKIATVLSVDLSTVAQAMPGDRISFEAVSLEEAHRAFHARAAWLVRLARSAPVVFSRRQLHVRVSNTEYSITTGLLEQRNTRRAPASVESGVEVVDGGTCDRLRVEIDEA